MKTYTITYQINGTTYTASVEAKSFEDADDAATELVAQFARSGQHITIVNVA